MKLNKKIEEKIKKAVETELKKGKPDWDIPHTAAAVYWMKKLIRSEGGNEKILVPAMYFHDTGYPLLKKGYSYEESIASKKSHAQRGANFAKKALAKIPYFTDKEIKEVAFLVKTHDSHRNLKTLDKQLVFEADGLAQLDWERVKPNFDKKNLEKWLRKYFEKERPLARWRTTTGRKNIQILLKKANLYVQKMK